MLVGNVKNMFDGIQINVCFEVNKKAPEIPTKRTSNGVDNSVPWRIPRADTKSETLSSRNKNQWTHCCTWDAFASRRIISIMWTFDAMSLSFDWRAHSGLIRIVCIASVLSKWDRWKVCQIHSPGPFNRWMLVSEVRMPSRYYNVTESKQHPIYQSHEHLFELDASTI